MNAGMNDSKLFGDHLIIATCITKCAGNKLTHHSTVVQAYALTFTPNNGQGLCKYGRGSETFLSPVSIGNCPLVGCVTLAQQHHQLKQ